MLERERVELDLSLTLNRRPDPEPDITQLGRSLNELRIQRRIYDYVVQAL